MFTDFEIQQGANDGRMFQISAEGGVYRRRPDTRDDYGCYGRLLPELNTPEKRAELLGLLRNARRGNCFARCAGANPRQTSAIVEDFNRRYGAFNGR